MGLGASADRLQAEPAEDDVGFGLDAAAATREERPWHVQYGTLWIGTWNLDEGWGDPVRQLERMQDHEVVPVIHLYYWGDDLSPRCFAAGCWSSLHGAPKDAASWHRLADELVERLDGTMAGERVIVLLEDEFNQIHTDGHDGFDRALAQMAETIRAGYPEADIVLPFGDWDREAWSTWDEAAAASDYIGIQALRGSTRHAADDYQRVYGETLEAVEDLQALFGKPIVVHDVAFSSYPEPAFLGDQADALHDFFEGLPALKEAGVRALMYRSFTDSPTADPANWFGEAERHFGLAWSGNGTLKPAGLVWLAGTAGPTDAEATQTAGGGHDGSAATDTARTAGNGTEDPLDAGDLSASATREGTSDGVAGAADLRGVAVLVALGVALLSLHGPRRRRRG